MVQRSDIREMAIPASFQGSNVLFTGEAGILPLPAFRTPDSGLIVSCWEFDWVEIMEIQNTKKVWVGIMGGQVPPMMLMSKSRMHSKFPPLKLMIP